MLNNATVSLSLMFGHMILFSISLSYSRWMFKLSEWAHFSSYDAGLNSGSSASHIVVFYFLSCSHYNWIEDFSLHNKYTYWLAKIDQRNFLVTPLLCCNFNFFFNCMIFMFFIMFELNVIRTMNFLIATNTSSRKFSFTGETWWELLQ